MKKAIYGFGFAAVFFISTSIMLSMMHWPGAVVLNVLGYTSLMVAATAAFIESRRYKRSRTRLYHWRTAIGFIAALLISCGNVFKVMHYFTANMQIVLGMVIFNLVFMPMFFYHLYRQSLRKEKELIMANNMLDIQDSERRRIAADLHDRLGSMLSTVKLYFNAVEGHPDNLKEQNRMQYQKATSLLDEACGEVRKIAYDLASSDLVKWGLPAALQNMKQTIENTGKMKMNLLCFGLEKRWGSKVETALYKIIQELMNNVLRHSGATEVTLQLNKLQDNLNIVLEDNGRGFNIEDAMQKDGMGLKNLQARVKGLDGNISFDSGKGRGTTVVIDVPLES